MLRHALIFLALAFAATFLHGCDLGGAANHLKGSKFLHDHCKATLDSQIDAIELTIPEGCDDKVVSASKGVVKHGWVLHCISSLHSGSEMKNFNESNTDIPEQVQTYSKNNTDEIETDIQDKVKDACEKVAHVSEHASNLSSQAKEHAANAHAAASAKAEEAKEAAAVKAEEVKKAASAKVEEAKKAAGHKEEGGKKNDADDEDEEGEEEEEEEESNTKLFELKVVNDAVGEKGKSVSKSFTVLAEVGIGLAVFGVVISVRLARQRSLHHDHERLADSEAELE